MRHALHIGPSWLRRGAIDFDDLVAGALPRPPGGSRRCSRAGGHARACCSWTSHRTWTGRSWTWRCCSTGERRDIFLVGDDDQTIYAWRLADVRRVLGLAARCRACDGWTSSPTTAARRRWSGGRRGSWRTAWSGSTSASSPRPRATGTLVLAPDPGDPTSRAPACCSTRWLRARRGRPRGPRTHQRASWHRSRRWPSSGASPGRAEQDRWRSRTRPDRGAPGRSRSDRDAHRPIGWPAPIAARDRADPADAPRTAPDAARLGGGAGRRSMGLRAALARARARPSRAWRPAGAALCSPPSTARRASSSTMWRSSAWTRAPSPAAGPSTRSPDPARALEEERRLAYVAWTRARSGASRSSTTRVRRRRFLLRGVRRPPSCGPVRPRLAHDPAAGVDG